MLTNDKISERKAQELKFEEEVQRDYDFAYNEIKVKVPFDYSLYDRFKGIFLNICNFFRRKK
jgi:hypothetical protein